jgi:hypothetical protein
MTKKEANLVFKDWNKTVVKIFKLLFVLKKGPDGYYYEKDGYEKIYCPNRLFDTLRLIAEVRTQLFWNA